MKHICWDAGINNSKIITETQFGHGDSTHNCYVKCDICGKESKRFGDYGLFNDKSLRSAQADWNNNKTIKLMKTLIILLLISCKGYSQYNFKLKEHKVSMGFTVMQGLADGFRDASMFGRVKWGRWYNESLDSWKLKYKNEDYTQGALYPGSTSLFVGISDAPHGANSISHFSGEMAKVYMPNMTGATFWQKFKTVLIYSAVRSIPHNIVNDIIFKRRK